MPWPMVPRGLGLCGFPHFRASAACPHLERLAPSLPRTPPAPSWLFGRRPGGNFATGRGGQGHLEGCLGSWPLAKRWDRSWRETGAWLRPLVVVAVGRASPVQGDAVLARRAGWAAPGRRQRGRPVGAAPVSRAGPGPRPHHGDGAVQLVRDALGALRRRAGQPGCGQLPPSALRPRSRGLGQVARPLRASPPPTSTKRGAVVPAQQRTGT